VQDAFHPLIGPVFAVVFCRIGWWMAQNPGKAYRFLSFGQAPDVNFFVGFSKAVGYCCAVAFGFGAIGYLVLILFDISRSR
jgi:hypothetical protein